MNTDADDSAPPNPPRGDASESLNDALDSLEDMLDRHDGRAPRESAAEEDMLPEDGDDEEDGDDAQYSIPLLNDIVTPPRLHAVPMPQAMPSDGDDYAEAVTRMAARLSSEIDVIVQSAVDEAIDLLRRDIGERLREHLDITLPEVLEELVHLRQDR